MDYKKLGRNIRTARKNLSMTQEVLSEKTDLSTVFISQIETGAGKPSLESMYRISFALGVPVDSLLKDEAIDTQIDEIEIIKTMLTGRTKAELRYVMAILETVLNGLENIKQ